jgi:hypothetical protein
MATPHNELVAALMEDRPRLASELYHATYGPDLPDHDAITIKRLQVGPPETAIRRMCVLAVYSMRGEATLGVLFDMVTAPDPGQAAAWLWFIQSAQRAVACPVALVVLCRDTAGAKWALAMSAVGEIGSFVIPLVIPEALREFR